MTLEEKIYERHARAGFICEYVDPDSGERCSCKSEHIAHCVSKGKQGRKAVRVLWLIMFNEELKGKKLDEVIHHYYNTRATCRIHNDSVMVGFYNDNRVMPLLKKIREDLDG